MSSLDVRSIDTKELRKAVAPATKQEFRVFLSEAAFDRAVARGDSDTTREIGGVLIGELLRDEAGPYLQIDGTIDALHAEEKGAELTFTHATWEHIHKEMDSKHQDKRVVGWYHTHPGFGIFLSDRDQFIHKSFFNLPFQVAFVYDPKTREHGMFTWHDNEVWRARRYWIGPREQAWDGQRAPTEKAGEKTGNKAGEKHGDQAHGGGKLDARGPATGDGVEGSAARDDNSLSGLLVPLVLVGIVLLVLGGLGGRWLGVGAANEAILQAQVEITKAKTEGAQAAIASLQNELVGILRDSVGDEALRTPVMEAVYELDRAIVVLPADGTPAASEHAPIPGASSAPGAGSTVTPGAGSAVMPGAGNPTIPARASAAIPAAGSAASGTAAPAGAGGAVPPSAGSAASGTGSAAAIAAVAPSTGATPGSSGLLPLAAQLRATRETLLRILQGRGTATVVLSQLERATRRGAELRADLGHDVAEQRAGLGAVYAELAAGAVKANDLDRARRLLATAAHLDPGNRTRYENQLQSFDKSAALPRDTNEISNSAGSAEQGATR